MELHKIQNQVEFTTSTKIVTHTRCCVEISHLVDVAKRARHQHSIFSIVQ